MTPKYKVGDILREHEDTMFPVYVQNVLKDRYVIGYRLNDTSPNCLSFKFVEDIYPVKVGNLKIEEWNKEIRDLLNEDD